MEWIVGISVGLLVLLIAVIRSSTVIRPYQKRSNRNQQSKRELSANDDGAAEKENV